MRYPFDNYLKVRILQRTGRAALVRQLRAHGLRTGDGFAEHLQALTDEVCAASPAVRRYVTSKARRPPAMPSWADLSHVLYDVRLMSDPEADDVAGALDLLEHPAAREITEILLLQGTPPGKVAQQLETRLGLCQMTGSVSTFAYYFWNVDDMSLVDLREWLNAIPDDELPLHRKAIAEGLDAVGSVLGVDIDLDLIQAADHMVAMVLTAMRRLMRQPNAELSEHAQTWARYFGSLIQASVQARKAVGAQEQDDDNVLRDLRIQLEEHGRTVGLPQSPQPASNEIALPQRADLVQANERITDTDADTNADTNAPAHAPAHAASDRQKGRRPSSDQTVG